MTSVEVLSLISYACCSSDKAVRPNKDVTEPLISP